MDKGSYEFYTAKGMHSLYLRLVSLYPNLGVKLVEVSNASPKIMLGYSELDADAALILFKAKQIELQPVIDDINIIIANLEIIQ